MDQYFNIKNESSNCKIHEKIGIPTWSKETPTTISLDDFVQVRNLPFMEHVYNQMDLEDRKIKNNTLPNAELITKNLSYSDYELKEEKLVFVHTNIRKEVIRKMGFYIQEG
ncbi:hypothetical protein RYX36_020190 [Vicia faba]